MQLGLEPVRVFESGSPGPWIRHRKLHFPYSIAPEDDYGPPLNKMSEKLPPSLHNPPLKMTINGAKFTCCGKHLRFLLCSLLLVQPKCQRRIAELKRGLGSTPCRDWGIQENRTTGLGLHPTNFRRMSASDRLSPHRPSPV